MDMLDLMTKYNLKEIRVQINDFTRDLEVTFYSVNKCIKRTFPINNVTNADSLYYTLKFDEMGRELQDTTGV